MNKTYCIFSAMYLPKLGGVERYTYNLAKHLALQGNKVIIITCNIFQGLEVTQVEELEGVEVIRVPCISMLKGRFPIIRLNREFTEKISRLDKIGIDAIIINTRFYTLSLYAALFAKKRDIPNIIIEHGTSHLTVNNKVLDFLGHIYEHSITYILKLMVNDFYGVSRACREWLKHFKIESQGECYNAIDIVEIEKLSEETSMNYREKYGLSKKDIIITYTGRLIKEKGIQELVGAFRELPSNYYLFIAGDGDLYEKIKVLNNPSIKLLGKLTFKEVIGLLNESDIFCLPSYSEGFSTSLLEAVACRCCIITSNTGGAKELIKSEEYGIVLEAITEEEIINAIQKVATNQSYRDKVIENAYKQLVKNFTWEKTTEKIVAIFNR